MTKVESLGRFEIVEIFESSNQFSFRDSASPINNELNNLNLVQTIFCDIKNYFPIIFV